MENIICKNCETQNDSNSKYCKNCGYELPVPVVNEAAVVKPIEQKSKSKKVNLLAIIAGIIAFGLANWGVKKLFFSPPALDKQLILVANEVNKTCPITVDAQTQLDNTMAMPNNTFQYNYTLVEMDKEKVDTTEFKAYMEPNILEQVRTSPQMKYFRDNKVTMNYLYRDKNKQYIVLIRITPDLYK